MLWHLLVLRLLHTQRAWAATLAAGSQRAQSQSDVVSALQQQPRAVAPIEEWGAVPPLGIGNSSRSDAHITQVPAGLSSLPIQAIIQQRRDAGVQLCLSVDGYLRGGLANSMAVVNIAMDYSMKNHLNFIMPKIVPIDHDLGDDFAFMFGSNPACAAHRVSVWPAACPPSSSLMGKTPGEPRIPREELAKHDGCNVSEQVVRDSYKDTTTACDCDELLLVRTAGMAWSYDYSHTGPVLSRMYWKNAPGMRSNSAALRFPLRTAMHVRLGDVENLGSTKFLAGETNAELAMALTGFIDAACLDVSILTDGEASDENVRAPLNAWTKAGASKTQVLDMFIPATVSLNTMAKADILIGGPSGFPRLAAVLGSAQVKLFINSDPLKHSHPIDYLLGVSEIGPHEIDSASVRWAAARALRQNAQVAEVATACKRWLASHASSSRSGSH